MAEVTPPPGATGSEAATPTPEKELPTRKRQVEEIGRVSSVAIQQKGRELSLMPEEQRKAKIDSDPGSGDILALYITENARVGDYQLNENGETQYNQDGSKKKGFDVTKDGKPLRVKTTTHGEVQVTHLRSFNEDGTFSVYISTGKPGEDILLTGNEAIKKEDIVKAQILATKDSILSSTSLTEAQKAVLEREFAYKEGGEDAIKDLGEDTLNKTITEAAEQTGMVSTNDLIAMSDKLAKPSADAPVELHEQYAAQMKTIKELTEGKNILDPETTIKVLEATGCTTQRLIEATQQINKAIAQLQQEIQQDPDNSDLKQKLDTLKSQAAGIQLVENVLANTGDIPEVFQNLERGNIDPALMKKFRESVRNGDINSLVQTLAPELQDAEGDDEATKAEKARARELMLTVTTGTGMGVGLLLLLALAASLAIGKEALR